jgi:hypothetical protein
MMTLKTDRAGREGDWADEVARKWFAGSRQLAKDKARWVGEPRSELVLDAIAKSEAKLAAVIRAASAPLMQLTERDIKYLDEIEARLKSATRGPWIDKGGDAFGVIASEKCLLATSYMLAPNSVDFRFESDRKFVVHSWADIRRLLEIVRAASPTPSEEGEA